MPELRLGFEVLRSYKRLSYDPWSALAEFVDNSTQSYFNHRAELDAAFTAESGVLTVAIRYDRNADTLIITDNSIGMDEATLERALVVGSPPPDPSGRSRYGMGLKTAACWFGDIWKVRTSRLGIAEELVLTVDVEEVARGNNELPLERNDADASSHYTTIEISSLHRTLHGRTLGKIRDYLSSMYRQDIESGTLRLLWQGQTLVWASIEDTLQTAEDGTRYRREFDFRIGDRRVHGWAGVLDKGSRAKAGFSILHAGRVIRGWPDSWRPETIFGQVQGSNNLVNQRLVGEIHLDDFEVTHTKDDILFEGTEQEQVEATLRGAIADLIAVANQTRGKRRRSVTRTAASEATSAIAVEVRTHSPLPRFSANGLAAASLSALEPVLAQISRGTPTVEAPTAAGRLSLFLTTELEQHDPYAVVNTGDELTVFINLNHSAAPDGLDGQAMVQHVRTALFDALTSIALASASQPVSENSLLTVKDQILRLWASGAES